MHYLHSRFSEYAEEMQKLIEDDAEFREACSNYEEICTWLEQQCPGQTSLGKECEDAREQKQDLEREILTLLEPHHAKGTLTGEKELHER